MLGTSDSCNPTPLRAHENVRPEQESAMRSMSDVPIGSIRRNPRNARTHSKKQIRQIANSIREFGFGSPLLIDDDCVLLAGHGRLAAAELLGLSMVPVVTMSGMT